MFFDDEYKQIKNNRSFKLPTFNNEEKIIQLSYPEGLVGEVAKFFYNSSPRPSVEIAVTGAIGFLAGICGRAYNISRTGLNQYLLLLAQTGTGKESMATGIDKLLHEMIKQVPAVNNFVGPAEIASGQALLKYIANTSTCFVSIVGEFGLKLQQLASIKASPSEVMLKRVLLDLYNKSGNNKILRSSIYADKDKNTESIMSPSLTILGESTPESFYCALTNDLIADGLLPRFTIVEYFGNRPQLNKNHDSYKPSVEMIASLCELSAYCLQLMHSNIVVDVLQEPDATIFFDRIDKESTDKINTSKEDVIRHLWNRAHIKTLKLASLIAVGINPTNPVINLPTAKWAYELIARDICNLTKRFEKGEIGRSSEEIRQNEDMKRIVIEYFAKDFSEIEKYGVYKELYEYKMIPYSYIHRRLISLSSFRNDRQTATVAIKRTIETFIESGEFVKVMPPQLHALTGKRGNVYMLCDPEMFFREHIAQKNIESQTASWVVTG